MRRLRVARTWLCLAGLLTGASACSNADGEIRGAVQLMATEQGELARLALARLCPHGRRALSQIETALHTAPPAGRRNLVLALRRIGDMEAAPLLGHLCAHDEDEGVRMEARWTLRGWVAEGGERGRRAAAVLRQADEIRGTEGTG